MERREYLIGSDDCDDQDVAERADEDDDAEDDAGAPAGVAVGVCTIAIGSP